MWISRWILTIFGLFWLAGIVTPGIFIWHQHTVIQDLTRENEQWRRLVKLDFDDVESKRVQVLDVTAYTPSKRETDDDPYVAASMRKVRPGTVAVSRDLFDNGWVFGKKIYIKGYGIYEINDLMNKRFNSRIDVFMFDYRQAMQFGKQSLTVALLDI